MPPSLARDVELVLKYPRKVYLVIDSTEYELGFTAGGIRFETTMETYDVECDQIGFLDRMIRTAMVQVTTPLLQWDIELLSYAYPHSVLTVGVTNKKLEIGTCTGKSLRDAARPLILRPENLDETDKTKDVKLYLAAPDGNQALLWNNEASKEATNVVWISFPDTSLDIDKNLAVIGDPAVVAPE